MAPQLSTPASARAEIATSSSSFASASHSDLYNEAFSWLSAPVDLSFPTRPTELPTEHRKRHKCSICSLRFRERKNLQAHFDEVHRKRRRFSCTHSRCGVVSNRRYNMMRHLRLMHSRPCRTPCSQCAPPVWNEVTTLADIDEVARLFDSVL